MHVFKNLTQFSYKRSATQAVAFYFVYLLGILVAAIIVAVILGIAVNLVDGVPDQMGAGIGTTVAALVSTFLTYMILSRKGILNNLSSFLFLVLALALSLFGGAIFGLIVPAYLTTREHTHHHQE